MLVEKIMTLSLARGFECLARGCLAREKACSLHPYKFPLFLYFSEQNYFVHLVLNENAPLIDSLFFPNHQM